MITFTMYMLLYLIFKDKYVKIFKDILFKIGIYRWTFLLYTIYMCIYYTSVSHIQSWKENILICLNIDSNQHPSTEVMRGMTNKNS